MNSREGSALTVTQIRAGYGDLTVVRNVSVEVRPGRVTALFGRNGAGKTTTLSAIGGLLPSASGHVSLGAVQLDRLNAWERVKAGLAFVQEGRRLFRSRTVEENLKLGGYPLPRKERQTAVERMYETFPVLGERRKVLAGALSGGQQQQLCIARALVPSPKAIMLDEPSAGLSPNIVGTVLDVIDALREQRLAVLLVEQRVDEALSIADSVVVIDQGQSVLSGPASDFRGTSLLYDVYFGRAEL